MTSVRRHYGKKWTQEQERQDLNIRIVNFELFCFYLLITPILSELDLCSFGIGPPLPLNTDDTL